MSKRRRAARPAGSPAPARGKPSAPAPGPKRRPRPPQPSSLAQVALLAAVLAAVTGVAELLGAANLGVALGTGTIAFTIALMWVMLRG